MRSERRDKNDGLVSPGIGIVLMVERNRRSISPAKDSPGREPSADYEPRSPTYSVLSRDTKSSDDNPRNSRDLSHTSPSYTSQSYTSPPSVPPHRDTNLVSLGKGAISHTREG